MSEQPGMLESGARDLPYYSFDKISSYNAVYNFVCGARGLGKTFGAKKRVINKFLRKGEEFILLRRFKTELPAIKGFFADIAHEWPQHQFRIEKNEFQVCREPKTKAKENKWERMGYFFALTQAQSLKGFSFHATRTIIFDEFIIEKGHNTYLPGETTVMTNFYSTVDRYKDRVKVFFLANSVSIENPYFITYKIRPDEVGELLVSKFNSEGLPFVAAHFPDAADFSKEVYKTRFGQFIEGTDYADYALKNEFGDNHKTMINRKPSNCEYAYTLETRDGTFSVWFHRKTGNYYLLERRPGNECMFTLIPSRVDEDKRLLVKNDDLLRTLRSAFKNGMMYFDQPHTREAMLNVFI